MSRKSAAKVEGVVSNVLSGGLFSVTLSDGKSVQAKLCERLAKFRIRVLEGDRVRVGLPERLIVSREKLGARECESRYR